MIEKSQFNCIQTIDCSNSTIKDAAFEIIFKDVSVLAAEVGKGIYEVAIFDKKGTLIDNNRYRI